MSVPPFSSNVLLLMVARVHATIIITSTTSPETDIMTSMTSLAFSVPFSSASLPLSVPPLSSDVSLLMVARLHATVTITSTTSPETDIMTSMTSLALLLEEPVPPSCFYTNRSLSPICLSSFELVKAYKHLRLDLNGVSCETLTRKSAELALSKDVEAKSLLSNSDQIKTMTPKHPTSCEMLRKFVLNSRNFLLAFGTFNNQQGQEKKKVGLKKLSSED